MIGLLGFILFFLINRELFKQKNLISLNMLIFATNAAFILYMRQCRYYAPTALFFLSNMLIMIRYYKRPSGILLAFYVISSVLLFLSQYNAALAIFTVLALVYGYFKKWNFKDRDLRALFAINILIILLIGTYLFLINNPFGNTEGYSRKGFNIGFKFYVFYRSLISFDIFALLSFPLVLFFFYFNKKQLGNHSQMFKFLILFLAINIFGFSIFALKYVVRYLVYLIPIAIIIEGFIIYSIWHWPMKYAKTLASTITILLIFTSVLYISTGKEANVKLLSINVNSHLIDYVDEINSQNPTSYSKIIDHFESKHEKDKPIYVHPVYMSCPLIFYMGDQYLFVNQIGREKDIQVHLPNYIYNYEISPDYIVICGPDIQNKEEILGKYRAKYEIEEHINFFYRDVTRPEYEWRNFDVVEDYNKDTETIFIFKKIA